MRAARTALKANKISGTWSASGLIYVKLVSSRITPIHNSEESRNVSTDIDWYETLYNLCWTLTVHMMNHLTLQ